MDIYTSKSNSNILEKASSSPRLDLLISGLQAILYFFYILVYNIVLNSIMHKIMQQCKYVRMNN